MITPDKISKLVDKKNRAINSWWEESKDEIIEKLKKDFENHIKCFPECEKYRVSCTTLGLEFYTFCHDHKHRPPDFIFNELKEMFKSFKWHVVDGYFEDVFYIVWKVSSEETQKKLPWWKQFFKCKG